MWTVVSERLMIEIIRSAPARERERGVFWLRGQACSWQRGKRDNPILFGQPDLAELAQSPDVPHV